MTNKLVSLVLQLSLVKVEYLLEGGGGVQDMAATLLECYDT